MKLLHHRTALQMVSEPNFRMKKPRKKLEWDLGQLQLFERPKIALEQYSTSAELTADVLMVALNAGHIEQRLVADLGCGCGQFAIGAALLGASRVVGFDIDYDALCTCRTNGEHLDVEELIDLVQCNICALATFDRYVNAFDTVIMNPPFGTKKSEGIDMLFVRTALQMAPVVYSLHKTSTRPYIQRSESSLNAKVDVLAQLRFDLPATYKFHRKNSVDVEVDLIRFSRNTAVR